MNKNTLQAIKFALFSFLWSFFGNKHFSQTNAFLQQNGLEPIDWQIENIE